MASAGQRWAHWDFIFHFLAFVCRVQLETYDKGVFLPSDVGNTRQSRRPAPPFGRLTALRFISPCALYNTRQSSLPCARQKAHDEVLFAMPLAAMSAPPGAAHGEVFIVGYRAFTVCLKHMVKNGIPVVIVAFRKNHVLVSVHRLVLLDKAHKYMRISLCHINLLYGHQSCCFFSASHQSMKASWGNTRGTWK